MNRSLILLAEMMRCGRIVLISVALPIMLTAMANAASVVSGFPQASQPLGALPDAVLLDQGTGCPTQTLPCTTSQSPSLRVGQPYQATVPPAAPFLYQLWWDTSVSLLPVLRIYDGTQWIPYASINLTTHSLVPPTGGQVLPKYGGGCTLANDGVSPNTVIDIAACYTADDSTNILMQQGAAYTKTTAAWALGTAAGCLDAGAVAVSTWYYLYEIQRADTGVVDYVCTATYGNPTKPLGYTRKRFIGAFLTDAAAHILPFTQIGNEIVWQTPIQDVDAATCGTAAATATLANVPSGYKVRANIRATIVEAVASPTLLLSSPDETDNPPGTPASNYSVIAYVLGKIAAAPLQLMTNTTQQIRQRCSIDGASLGITTVGWIDPQIAWPH